MRYEPISPQLFVENRKRLAALLPPGSLAVVNANDTAVTNADGTQETIVNTDLFYLTGVEQERARLIIFPDADDARHREILFLREANPLLETWEGHKLSKIEAREKTGVSNIQWLDTFPSLFQRMMCECEHVYLDSNEHSRAVIEVETREARFVSETRRKYPLHDYRRLAGLMHRLRAVKSAAEIQLLRKACDLTRRGFLRVLKFTRPGVREFEIEAEFAHEFIRGGGRFAYPSIVASGRNSNCLHYVANDQVCRDGDLLLLDVGAAYANYNSDSTRTIPVNGRFTRRQRQVYESVLKIQRECIAALVPGTKIKDWQKLAEQSTERELVHLGLITMRQIRRQSPDEPAFKKYFMHGVGHPLGLDVHDVAITTEPIQPGWVMTVEPGIYIPEEGFGIRLENDVLVTENAPVDLLADMPIEPDEIEALMAKRKRS